MAKETGIAYVHHTRNFWSGCTRVSDGCTNCYAEAFNRWVRGKNEETGEAKNWGPGAPRIPHLEGAARDLRKWDREAREAGEYRRVFLNTNSDTFDNEVAQAWRDCMFAVMQECTWLDFLLVTKRIGNVRRMVPAQWMNEKFPPNVRLLITVVNQEEADRDIPKLLALPCKNGISYEPALGPVDWSPFLGTFECDGDLDHGRCGNAGYLSDVPLDKRGIRPCSACGSLAVREKTGIEWIIVGGESAQGGAQARPFDLAWARSTVAQCKAAGVPVFVKQLGANAEIVYPDNSPAMRTTHERVKLKDRAGADPSEWPEDLRVREFP